MSDPSAQTGPVVQNRRKPSSKGAVATGAGLALITGAADWIILQCYAGGHWHWVAPSQTLIEMAAPILLFPLAHYVLRVLTALGRIFLNPLERAAGPGDDDQ